MTAWSKLSPRHQLFVREYLVDFSQRAAGVRAGFSKDNTRVIHTAGVREAIDEALAERAKRVGVDPEAVLREILAIAMTDTNEIISYRRVCCRYCWGNGHDYQYTTRAQLDAARKIFDHTIDALVDDFKHGGIGFEPQREPNEDCPECSGEGVGDVHIRDTRTLSPGARALYAGIKVTKDGIEVKLHDKSKHLELLARHLGLLNDKLNVNVDSDIAERLLEGRKRAGGT